MTHDSKEAQPDVWPERIRAVSSGIKDIVILLLSGLSIYLQTDVRGKQDAIEAKVDVAAVKAEEVRQDLKANKEAVEQ